MYNLKFKIVYGDNQFYLEQCFNLIKENYNASQGDLLRVKACKYLLCALEKNQVIGFISLREEAFRSAPLFITELAVKNQYDFEEIAFLLLDYLKNHCKNYNTIIAKDYTPTKKLEKYYQKSGFMFKNNCEKRFVYYPKKDNSNVNLIVDEEIEKE